MTASGLQAGEWWARVRSGALTPKTQRVLSAWLKNPENRRAFAEVAQANALLDEAQSHPEIAAMLAEAVDDIDRRPAIVRRNRLAAAAAGLALAACAAVAVYVLRPAEYATGPGQRREIALNDGSKLTLDQASRVRVAYSLNRRALTLMAGRAEFDVAKDHARPFVVTAEGKTVTAVGTLFDVRVTDAGMAVTLARGIVAVSDVKSPARAITLSPGQRLTNGPRGVALQNVDIAKATAWSMGKAVFDDERLADAVAEMNAYAKRKIVLVGGLTCARLTAVYDLADTEGFVEGVSREFSLRVNADADETIRLEDPQARPCTDFREP